MALPEPINVSLSGLPSGVVAMPANFLLTPGTPQQISLTVAATDTAAAATLVFSASSGTLAHTAELPMTITPPQPNFSLQVAPAALTLNAGGGAQSVSVAATALYGFSGPVNVVLSGLPAAVTASPSNVHAYAGSRPNGERDGGLECRGGHGHAEPSRDFRDNLEQRFRGADHQFIVRPILSSPRRHRPLP